MNKRKKRILSIFAVIAMLAAFMPVMPASAAASINIGDYLEMGTYYGAPILWRCVDIDENGPLMLSDKIICLKAFDAAGTNTSGSHGRGYYFNGTQGYYRQRYGSNYWADSNIRCWLNSLASAGNVNWSCGNPPDNSHVWSGYNDYADEAGFLTNFTQGERNAIKEVTQKSLLDGYEYSDSSNTINSDYHRYSYSIGSVVQNYDTAFSEQVTDRMFLPDVKQINAVYNNSSILGSNYYIGEPTAQCVANSEYKNTNLIAGNKWYAWLRSPYAYDDGSCGVRLVSSGGGVNYGSAYSTHHGVRPAFYLNLSSSRFTGGSGTASAPYKVSGTGGHAAVATPAPQISTNNNYSGGDSLIQQAGIDANNLLSNISVGTDTIKGPKISIFDHDFYLFQLDGKCSLKLGDVKIQVKVSEDKNSIQILGGYDFLSESVSTGTDYSGRGEWTKAYNDLKSLHNALVGGKLDDKTARSKFSSVYNKLNKADSNLFLNIKGNFALYGELTWSNGEWKLTEGGGIIKASASGSIDPRIGGIFYGTFGLSVDASGSFAVKLDGIKNPLSVDAKLKIEPAVNVGVGAGSKKAKFYIEGGLKGKLPIEIAAVTGSFKTGASITPLQVKAQGYIYISGKAGVFSVDKEWQLGGDVVLYPRSGDLQISSAAELTGIYSIDKSEFKMIPRDYGGGLSIMNAADSFDNTVFDKTNIYPYSTPKLAKLSDGRMLLLWIDDDPSKADADRTSMYYSIYSAGEWSEPEIAVSNAGYNDMPQIYVNGGNVYVVWTAIDEALGDSAELDDMLSRLDLYYTYFDGSGFAAPELVSDAGNGLCETLYAVTERNGTVTVAWAENSENELSLASGTNYIYKRELSGGTWSDKKKVAQTSAELHDIALDMYGNVIYELGAEEKSALYLGGDLIGESENDNSAFQVIDDKIFYFSGSNLNIYDGGMTETADIGEITDITIVDAGDRLIALSLLSTGFTNELYQNEYIGGIWGDWTQLTDYNKYIRDYSVTADDNGNITIALNLVEVKDDEKGGYGNAELKVISDIAYSDIILGKAPYYDGDASEGTVDICFNVTNNSRYDINTVNAEVKNATGALMYSGAVECAIAPGATETLSVPIAIPDGFKKQELTIRISGDFEENDPNNNTAAVTVGFADIAIERTELISKNGVLTLAGCVKNNGFADASNTILKIYDSDATGELLDTLSLGTISAGDEKGFEFALPEQYIYYTEGKTAVYLETETESEEIEIGDNSDRIVFADLSEIESIDRVSMSYSDGILTVDSPEAMGVDFIAAYYDTDGTLMGCRKAELAIGMGRNSIAVEGVVIGSNVKLMLWDKSMKPLCDPLIW